MSLLLDLLFPKKCVGCKSVGTYFCKKCIQDIKQTDLVCPKCERASIGGVTHPICERKFGLSGLWSLGIYTPPLKQAIQALKYKHVRELSDNLVGITLEYWAKYQPFLLDKIKKDQGKGWVVVPVPLHWYRKNYRGFNQSALFAQNFAEKLDLKYLDCLERVKYTKPQAKLKGQDRFKNIKNAFSLSPNCSLTTVNCVLLIDDVWTTGSTLRECCYVLKRSGVKNVWALTLAR